jgi:hypothetical protein
MAGKMVCSWVNNSAIAHTRVSTNLLVHTIEIAKLIRHKPRLAVVIDT